MPERLVVAIADGAVVVRDVEGVQLHHQPVAVHQPFVFAAAVVAAAPEQFLVPPAAGFDVGHDEEGLGVACSCSFRKLGSDSDVKHFSEPGLRRQDPGTRACG